MTLKKTKQPQAVRSCCRQKEGRGRVIAYNRWNCSLQSGCSSLAADKDVNMMFNLNVNMTVNTCEYSQKLCRDSLLKFYVVSYIEVDQ